MKLSSKEYHQNYNKISMPKSQEIAFRSSGGRHAHRNLKLGGHAHGNLK